VVEGEAGDGKRGSRRADVRVRAPTGLPILSPRVAALLLRVIAEPDPPTAEIDPTATPSSYGSP
jgi:hypothetical protein